MSILISLKTSTASRPTKYPREKPSAKAVFVKALTEQIGLVRAKMEGKTFTVTKDRYVRAEDGTRRRQQVDAEPRPWWWVGEDGTHLIQLNYGRLPMAVDPKRPDDLTLVAGKDLKSVLTVLEAVHKATLAGELDGQIEATAAKVKRSSKPKIDKAA